MEIWLELCFDDVVVDDIYCSTEEEAQEILNEHEKYPLSREFHQQNQALVEWWLEEGHRDNPVVTIRRTK